MAGRRDRRDWHCRKLDPRRLAPTVARGCRGRADAWDGTVGRILVSSLSALHAPAAHRRCGTGLEISCPTRRTIWISTRIGRTGDLCRTFGPAIRTAHPQSEGGELVAS